MDFPSRRARTNKGSTPGFSDRHIEALALAALGRETEAVARLVEEEHKDTLLLNLRLMLAALRALFEGKNAESRDALNKMSTGFGGPEGRYYLGRHLARLGETARALGMLGDAVDRGFFCYPGIVRDPWLDPLRSTLEFARILRDSKQRWRQAVTCFTGAGGEEILGIAHRSGRA